MISYANVKRIVPFVSIAAVLSVCAVASRARGKTLSAIISNNVAATEAWESCAERNFFFYSRAIGQSSGGQTVCETRDGDGSTNSVSCPSTAAFHRVSLQDALFFGMMGPVWGTTHCTGSLAAWTSQNSCSKTVSARNDNHPTCQSVTFTAGSWGDP
jgi:hypothetical protein